MVATNELNAPLFDRVNMRQVIDGQTVTPRIDSVVWQIPPERLKAFDDAQLVEPLIEELAIAPIVLDEAHMSMEWQEVHIDGKGEWHTLPFVWDGRSTPGVYVRFAIPYSGSSDLWRVACGSIRARGRVRKRDEVSGELELAVVKAGAPTHEELSASLQELLGPIRLLLAEQRQMLTEMNEALPILLCQAIQRRRERLASYERLPQDLQIPLRQRAGTPDYATVKVQPRISKPVTETAREPAVSDDAYEAVLSVIRHFGRSLEATPRMMEPHGEEEIRDVFLAALNTYFEGRATGETFRRAGKTDILIEEQNRAAFIGECKLWRGASEVSSALKQLLSYTTWRDTKCALLFFNKEVRHFAKVAESLGAALKKTTIISSVTPHVNSAEWRLRIMQADGRGLQLHVFLFDFCGTSSAA